jgi:hypothetical protein
MSNNKQMSVIDMLKQDLDIEIKSGVKMIVNWDGYKAIHKEEIENAYDAGLFDGSMDNVNDRMYKRYYNETFGDNNE